MRCLAPQIVVKTAFGMHATNRSKDASQNGKCAIKRRALEYHHNRDADIHGRLPLISDAIGILVASKRGRTQTRLKERNIERKRSKLVQRKPECAIRYINKK